MKKETVGKKAVDLVSQSTASDFKHTVTEQTHESLTDYEKNVIICAERGLKEYNSNFYIIVLTKKEPTLTNVIRNFFFHRKSCPTPEYDQTVYEYIYESDGLMLRWCIPDKETCEVYRTYSKVVDKSEQELLKFILDFYDGKLDRLARALNKEEGTTQFLENMYVKVPNGVDGTP